MPALTPLRKPAQPVAAVAPRSLGLRPTWYPRYPTARRVASFEPARPSFAHLLAVWLLPPPLLASPWSTTLQCAVPATWRPHAALDCVFAGLLPRVRAHAFGCASAPRALYSAARPLWPLHVAKLWHLLMTRWEPLVIARPSLPILAPWPLDLRCGGSHPVFHATP